MEKLLALDGATLLWIQAHLRAPWLTPPMLLITGLGSLGRIWILLSLILLCFRRTRRAGAAGLLALLFSLVVNNLFLKNLVGRIRPYEVVEGLVLLTRRAGDFSFPSGHAGTSFAAATAIFLSLPRCRWKWLLYVLAALIAFSRLYVGIHYPTDVIAGAVIGALCGLAAARIAAAAWKRFM